MSQFLCLIHALRTLLLRSFAQRGQPARAHESYLKLAEFYNKRADPTGRNVWSLPDECTDGGVSYVDHELDRIKRRRRSSLVISLPHIRTRHSSLRASKMGAALGVIAALNPGQLEHKTHEVSVAKAIANASFYYLAATQLRELEKILTCLRWIQARFALETSMGGIYGVIGLVNDLQLAAEQISKFRSVVFRKEGKDRRQMLSWIRDFLVLVRCHRTMLVQYPILVAQTAFNQPDQTAGRHAAELLLSELQKKRYSAASRVWLSWMNKPKSKMIGVYGPFGANTCSVAASPGHSKQLAIGLKTGGLLLVNSATGAIMRVLVDGTPQENVRVVVCRFCKEGNMLLTANDRGDLVLWDTTAGGCIASLPSSSWRPKRGARRDTKKNVVSDARITIDRVNSRRGSQIDMVVTVVCGGIDQSVQVYTWTQNGQNRQNGQHTQNTSHSKDAPSNTTTTNTTTTMIPTTAIEVHAHILSLAVSNVTKMKKSRICAVGLMNGRVLIVDISSPNVGLVTLHELHASHGVCSVVFCDQTDEQSSYLAIGTTMGKLSVWNGNEDSGLYSVMIHLDGHDNAVTDMTFTAIRGRDGSESNKFLVTGSMDGTIKIWNPFVHCAHQVLEFMGHKSGVMDIDVGDYGSVVFSAGGRDIRVWDISFLGARHNMLESQSSDSGITPTTKSLSPSSTGMKRIRSMQQNVSSSAISVTQVPVHCSIKSSLVLSTLCSERAHASISATTANITVTSSHPKGRFVAFGYDTSIVRISKFKTSTLNDVCLLARPDILIPNGEFDEDSIAEQGEDWFDLGISGVSSLSFNITGSMLAVGYTDGTVSTWSIRSTASTIQTSIMWTKTACNNTVSVLKWDTCSNNTIGNVILVGCVDGSISCYRAGDGRNAECEGGKRNRSSASRSKKHFESLTVCGIEVIRTKTELLGKRRVVALSADGVCRIYAMNENGMSIKLTRTIPGNHPQAVLRGISFAADGIYPCCLYRNTTAQDHGSTLRILYCHAEPTKKKNPGASSNFASYTQLGMTTIILELVNETNVELIQVRRRSSSAIDFGLIQPKKRSVMWRETSDKFKPCTCTCILSICFPPDQDEMNHDYIVTGHSDGRVVVFYQDQNIGFFVCTASVVSITFVVANDDGKSHVLIVCDAEGGISILRMIKTWKKSTAVESDDESDDESNEEKEKVEEKEEDDVTVVVASSPNIITENNTRMKINQNNQTPEFFDIEFQQQNEKNSVSIAVRAINSKKSYVIECIVQRAIAEFTARRHELGIHGVIGVFGGAAGLYELLVPKLRRLIENGVVRVASECGCILLDGGTASGLMEFVGSAVGALKHSAKSSNLTTIGDVPYLVGCLPYDQANWDNRMTVPKSAWPSRLEKHHDLFVLVEGNKSMKARCLDWGSETEFMFRIFNGIAASLKVKKIAILANGGTITKKEALSCVRNGIPLILIEGSNRVTDKICSLRRTLQECAKTIKNKLRGRSSAASHQTKDHHNEPLGAIRGVASVVAGEILLGDHDHDEESLLQEEDDEEIREIANSANVFIFSIADDANELALMIRELLGLVSENDT